MNDQARTAARRLADAEARYQRWMALLKEAAAEANDARADAFEQANADGLSMREVAEIVGLSHQRVSQIVHSPRRAPRRLKHDPYPTPALIPNVGNGPEQTKSPR